MRTLLRFLRSNQTTYHSARALLMFMKRRWYGLDHVDKTFYMAGRSRVHSDLVAGPYSFINYGCNIGPRVELGPYAMFGPRVAVVGDDHIVASPGVPIIFAGRPSLRRTVIEADAWVGYGAVLMAGVTIGRGAIVATQAVVTKDVPPYEIHAGVPARKIGVRFRTAEEIAVHDLMLTRKPTRGQYAGAAGEPTPTCHSTDRAPTDLPLHGSAAPPNGRAPSKKSSTPS